MESLVDAYEDWNTYSPWSQNVIVIGNKLDVKKRQVDYEDAEIWAEKRGYRYIQTSAKNTCFRCTEALYHGLANILTLETEGARN